MPEVPQGAEPGRMPRRSGRRFRSHLVNHMVRLRLVLDDVVFALLAALTAIGILYFVSNREIGDSLYSAHVSIKETRELLTSGVKVAGVVTFVSVMLFGFWSIIDAHRIAGPMHRLHRLLHAIGQGDLAHGIRFRPRDEFPEIAEAVDEMVIEFGKRLSTIKRGTASLEESLSVATLTPEQIEDLRRQAAELTSALAFFRIPEDGSGPTIDNSPIQGS